jgi:hypothetical protein
MKKTLTAFVAASMLATVPLAASTQNAAAIHKQWHKGLATGVGVGIGLGVIGALTQPRQRTVVVQQPPVYVAPAPQPVPVYGGGFSQAHYQYCFSRYRSYDAPSNTFQPYGGPRRPCYSPY